MASQAIGYFIGEPLFMSHNLARQQQPSEPEEEKKRIEIPAWWGIVAAIMAGLVFLPIQYERQHNKKPVSEETSAAKEPAEATPAVAEAQPPAQEKAEPAAAPAKPAVAEAEPAAPEKAEPAKPSVAELEPPAMAKSESAEAQMKPAPAETESQPKPKVEQAEPAKPAAAPAPKQAEDVKPAVAPVIPAAAETKKTAEKLKVEDALFFRVDGKDKNGRAASFDFVILTNAYTWARGSTNQVISAGKVIPETEVAGRVMAPKVLESLASASDLIAVGLASKDGKRADEEARALARSKTVAGWMTKVGKPNLPVWTLTLGQYKGCKQYEDKDSSFERPVIFVGVRSKQEGANLQEALADALEGHDNLPGRACYSRFDMEKVR
jgi:chemotaxis protein histidine kinase CheA